MTPVYAAQRELVPQDASRGRRTLNLTPEPPVLRPPAPPAPHGLHGAYRRFLIDGTATIGASDGVSPFGHRAGGSQVDRLMLLAVSYRPLRR